MSASTAHAAAPRPAAAQGVKGLGVRGSLPNPQPPNPFSAEHLPPGVHLGHTSIEPLRRLPSQLSAIDDLLDGGLPRGRVSELVGPLSSGKTSLLIAFLAAATRRSEVAAYVDLTDSLHPQSFVTAGVDLERLLWVRPSSLKDAVRCTEIILQAGGFAAVALDLGLLPAHKSAPDHRSPITDHRRRPLTFRLNVWPRLARAAEQSRAALVVLAPQRVTGSVAVLSIETHARPLWNIASPVSQLPSPVSARLWPLFDGFDVSVTVARSKLGPAGRSGQWLVAGGW